MRSNKRKRNFTLRTAILKIVLYRCNELGGGRRLLDSDATDVGLSGFPKEQQTHSGDDLMIRNNTVSYYNTNRSRLVTVQCINTGVGAPVDRGRLTEMNRPNPTLNSVRIIVRFLCMASSPVTISHQLILDIYIV